MRVTNLIGRELPAGIMKRFWRWIVCWLYNRDCSGCCWISHLHWLKQRVLPYEENWKQTSYKMLKEWKVSPKDQYVDPCLQAASYKTRASLTLSSCAFTSLMQCQLLVRHIFIIFFIKTFAHFLNLSLDIVILFVYMNCFLAFWLRSCVV